MAASLCWLSLPPTRLSKHSVCSCPRAIASVVGAFSRDLSNFEKAIFDRSVLANGWPSSLRLAPVISFNQLCNIHQLFLLRPTVLLHVVKPYVKALKLYNLADCSKRKSLIGLGALTGSLLFARLAPAKEETDRYTPFVDFIDGYSYVYPSDWRDFDFLGHDSAFKDRVAALQHVRVGFIPTTNNDIRDLGPMQEVVFDLVKNVYAAPTQIPTIYDIQERTVDGRNYWTFEYDLESSGFARTAFATIAIGNGRYYTLVVGANQRRWSKLRNLLKVVADSFRIINIKSAADKD